MNKDLLLNYLFGGFSFNYQASNYREEIHITVQYVVPQYAV